MNACRYMGAGRLYTRIFLAFLALTFHRHYLRQWRGCYPWTRFIIHRNPGPLDGTWISDAFKRLPIIAFRYALSGPKAILSPPLPRWNTLCASYTLTSYDRLGLCTRPRLKLKLNSTRRKDLSPMKLVFRVISRPTFFLHARVHFFSRQGLASID